MAESPQPIEEMQEEDYALDRDVVTTLFDALDAEDPALVGEILEPMHPADIADLFEQIGSGRLRALLAIWTSDEVGAVLSEQQTKKRKKNRKKENKRNNKNNKKIKPTNCKKKTRKK